MRTKNELVIRTHDLGKEQQTVSIDLIGVLPRFVLVTSEGLKYMMVRSWDVGVGKRAMHQAITLCSDSSSYVYCLEIIEIERLQISTNNPLNK
jgi:hypothetical protein